MQLTHIPKNGDNAAIGFRLSCSQLTAPHVKSTVAAAKVDRRRGSEAQFFAFEVAEMLIHRQAGHRAAP